MAGGEGRGSGSTESYNTLTDKWSTFNSGEKICESTLIPIQKRYIYCFGGKGGQRAFPILRLDTARIGKESWKQISYSFSGKEDQCSLVGVIPLGLDGD